MDSITIIPARKRRIDILRVNVVRERTMSYATELTGPSDVANAVRTFLGDTDREHFLVAFLSHRHKINALEVVAIGTIASVHVTGREVFKSAVASNASSLALIHTHPSGCALPSADDIAITRTLMGAGELLGIRVLDHVIVAHDSHVSLREQRADLWREAPFHA